MKRSRRDYGFLAGRKNRRKNPSNSQTRVRNAALEQKCVDSCKSQSAAGGFSCLSPTLKMVRWVGCGVEGENE
jgi:hypothetical protein